LYDFGDSWRHDLLLEAIVLPDPATSYPRCVIGGRRTPPEDVGGSPGYEDYLEALADPEHKEHENVLRWRGPFDPEAFPLTAVNQQLQKKFRSAQRKATTHGSPPGNTATDHSPNSVPLPRVLTGSGMPKARKRIQPEEKVPLELNDRERQLILNHSFADPELTDLLRLVPAPAEPPIYRFTLDDLDELAGYIASEANHAKDKKLQREWDRLYARLSDMLESYTDQDN
jgi:hypothetical protein